MLRDADQTSNALTDMSAINRLISAQVEKELAPLRQQNADLQKKVDNLEVGIVGIGSEMVSVRAGLKEVAGVWRTPEFGDFFEGLLKKANDAGRSVASGAAAPAQASSLDSNLNNA